MEKGSSSSEFKLTLVLVVLGTALEGLAGVLHTLQDAGAAAPWFPAVLATVGAILQVLTALGYTRSRTAVKVADLMAPAAPGPK